MATVKKLKRSDVVARALALARDVGEFPGENFYLDYDKGADVLYISFQRPQKATDTRELDDDGILLHYRGRQIVGITILDASLR